MSCYVIKIEIGKTTPKSGLSGRMDHNVRQVASDANNNKNRRSSETVDSFRNEIVTNADGSRGGTVFIGVCLSVCLSVGLSARYLTADAARITKLAVVMFQCNAMQCNDDYGHRR